MIKQKLEDTKIEKILTKPKTTIKPDETASKIAGKMEKGGLYSLPVKKDKHYEGVVTAEGVFSAKFPTRTKAKSILVHPPVLSPNDSLMKVCIEMDRNDLRMVPIKGKKGFAGILTFWDIASWAKKQKELEKTQVNEITRRELLKIRGEKEINKATTKIREKRAKRLLVAEQNKNIRRLLNAKKLAKKVGTKQREKMGREDRAGEKDKRLSINTDSLAEMIKYKVDESDSINQMLQQMVRYNLGIIRANGSFITFRDILKYFSEMRDIETQKVKFVVDGELEPFTEGHMERDLQGFLRIYHRKFGKRTIKEFKIHIKKIHKKGGKKKYMITAKLITDFKDFYAEKDGWDPVQVFDELIDALEKQMRG